MGNDNRRDHTRKSRNLSPEERAAVRKRRDQDRFLDELYWRDVEARAREGDPVADAKWQGRVAMDLVSDGLPPELLDANMT